MKNSIIMGSYVPSSGGLDSEIGGIPMPVILLIAAAFVVAIIIVCISMATNKKKSAGQSAQPRPVQPVQPMQNAPVQPMQNAPVQPMQNVPVQPVQSAPVQPVQPIQPAPVPPVQSVPIQPAPMPQPAYASSAEDDGTQIMPEGDDSTQILSQEYILSLTDTKNPAQVFQMPLNGVVVVGRKAGEANLVIDYEKSVSGRHCQLKEVGGRIYVEDLQSANGTLVNGIRIQSETEITSGSILTLGRLELKVDIRLQ